jgi:cobalt-zinc-cadmium efflux system membrane fusion protein
LKRAVARLELYGGKLGSVNGMYPLQSPLEGTLVDKHINPGQEVRPDQILANVQQYTNPLFVVSDPSKLSVLLDVTELDLNKLKAGEPLTIRSRAYPDRAFQGKLEVIGQALDPQTRTIYARGYVDNPERLLKAEMYVSVEVGTGIDNEEGGRQSGASSPEFKEGGGTPVDVPVKAVFSKESEHFVFLEKAPGEYERHAVKVGDEHEGRVAVLAGLKPGERVVTDGCLLLEALTEGGGKD